MKYPYDDLLRKDEIDFLNILRRSTPCPEAQFSIDFLEDDFPHDFKALIHTYAYHRLYIVIDDVWLENPKESLIFLSDLHDEPSFESELDGISQEHTFLIATSAGGEVYYFVGAKPGDARMTMFELQTGGYVGDGLTRMGGLLDGLRHIASEAWINGAPIDGICDEEGLAELLDLHDEEDEIELEIEGEDAEYLDPDCAVLLRLLPEFVPNGTAYAPPTLKLGRNDWTQNIPGHTHTLVLAWNGKDYSVKVADATTVYELPVDIHGKSIPFFNGPIDGQLLVSDRKTVYDVNMCDRSVREICSGDHVTEVVRVGKNFLIGVDGELKLLGPSLNEKWSYELPEGVDLLGFGTNLLLIVYPSGLGLWVLVSDTGLFICAKTDEKFVFATSVLVGTRYDSYVYTSWNPSTPMYRVENVNSVVSSKTIFQHIPTETEARNA